MILVDASVWVDYLRRGNAVLSSGLNRGHVLTHPFIIGELACGRLESRAGFLSLLGQIPQVPAAERAEVLAFVEDHALTGTGIGLVDAHLLASAALAGYARLWTLDTALHTQAERLGLAAEV